MKCLSVCERIDWHSGNLDVCAVGVKFGYQRRVEYAEADISTATRLQVMVVENRRYAKSFSV